MTGLSGARFTRRLSPFAILTALIAVIDAAEPAPTLPLSGGLPVIIRTGLRFEEIADINENERSCTATVDLRLRWTDTRLAYPKEDGSLYQNFRDAAAETRMATMWVPRVELANTIGTPSFRTVSLRIHPDGRVELMQRTTGKFATTFHPQRFPFDQQTLGIEIVVR